MKRKSLLFFLLAAMFLPLAANAQTVTIGDGTSTTNNNPIGTFYNYSYTQQLYTADEIGQEGYILSIGFQYSSTTDKDFPVVVYMKTVDDTELTTDFLSVSTTDVVFNGTMSATQGWVTIELDNPFNYDGKSNLLIAVDKGYVYWFSGGNWNYTATSSNMANYFCNDNTDPDPLDPPTANGATSYRPNVQITFGTPPTCAKPTLGEAQYIEDDQASIQWTENGTATNWVLQYSTASDFTGATSVNRSGIPALVIDDLIPGTTYYVRVKADCGSGDQSDWSNVINFTTNLCADEDMCEITYSLSDSYGDGWNGNTIKVVDVATNIVLATWTISSGSSANGTLAVCDGREIQFQYTGTSYPGENSWVITDLNDEVIWEVDSPTGNLTKNYTVNCTVPTCPKPKNLALSIDGATVTATWTDADNANIDINSTVTEGVTSPYTFAAELSTTYTVKVQADCGNNDTSDWTDPVSITTPDCLGGRVIEYTLTDSYNDGWEGAYITIIEGCGNVVETLTVASGASPLTGTLTLCGDYYEFVYTQGNYPSEYSWTFTEGGTTLFSGTGSSSSDGQVLYTIGTQAMPKPTALTAGTPEAHSVALSWTENGTATAWQICVNGDESNLIDANSNPFTLTGLASETTYTVKVRATNGTTESCWSNVVTFTTAQSSCTKPTNLAESDITTNSATLSWNGTSDSYVLQYRPWYQVGEDQVATAVLTPYTFDLSEYSGTGSIAIRHYDVSDMFQLNVDDIVVTNAAGTTVYSQNFENGITSEISNMDLDGDGYIWGIRQNGTDDMGNPYCNGNSCASSASWDGIALTPDNWMIISGIELGGQITFIARGQDPEWAQENFAVYVSAEADNVEVAVRETTYQIEDLEPNTPYAWQVKGICSDDESAFASSFFKTKDDVLVFTTAGNWNVVANWKDAEGNTATALPTVDNNVRIDAAATIPANYVAYANKATIGTGSILIKDGGQLKQNSATLKVTMEKEITGYGESDGNYYFIATPFSGRALFDEDTDWNHIENMLTGEYDLYAFDATAADGLEWINYKASPTHISFSSNNGNEGLIGSEGYLYANQDGTTLNFVGSIGKGINYSETKDYTYNDGAYDWDGWALVGNFFSCNAYLSYVDASGNVLDADFYTLNSDNTYTLMSSNEALPTCTGALMNVSATGKIQYATEAPAKRTGFLNMNVSRGNKTVSQARLRFGQGHNLGSMSFRNGSRLYMNVDGNDYAVVYTEKQGEMPVSFKADENGTYTISFNNEEVSFGYLHLIDNMTGNDVDLLQTPSYSFEASTTDYASRFKLVFATGNADDNFAFFSNGSFVINNEGNATVQVIDVNGRILSSENINGCANLNVNAAAGVYMLRLVNGDNVKVQKVVVR